METSENSSDLRAHVLVARDKDDTPELSSLTATDSLCYRVSVAASGKEALEVLEREHVDVVLAELSLPDMSGIDLLAKVRRRWPQTAVLIMTGDPNVPSAVQAIKLGAHDYLAKPANNNELLLLLQHVVQKMGLGTQNPPLSGQVRLNSSYGSLLGEAPSMQELFNVMTKVSRSHYSVLILGETGTGKELVARSIHYNGPLRDKSFLPVDCSALVPTLIESELFGYVRGSFTGAMRTKQGLLEAAQGGTLFLDEIAEIPVGLQAKLLRALQEREVKPVGSTRRVKFDARIIAATNRDLESAIQQGTFRKDLYFRLNVITLKLPPLRERKSDIPLLVNHFLDEFCKSEPRRPVLSQEALDCLMAYHWPGNVRELENCVERALALRSGPVLGVGDLPSGIYNPRRTASVNEIVHELVLPLRDLEQQAVLKAVAQARGDKDLAARMLGIAKSTLYRKLKTYGTA